MQGERGSHSLMLTSEEGISFRGSSISQNSIAPFFFPFYFFMDRFIRKTLLPRLKDQAKFLLWKPQILDTHKKWNEILAQRVIKRLIC
jgi:hypothetical protein